MQKITLVTGANAGIGFETALALAKQDCKVILHSRTREKGQQARDAILTAYPAAQLDVVVAELGELTEVKAMADDIKARYTHLDSLINNAGIWNSDLELGYKGIENVMVVNHLAAAYLAHLLYPLLVAAPDGRMICVASDSHKQIKGMYWDDLNLTKNYHGLRSYAQSKLAMVLFTYEWARRCPTSVSSYAIQPGLVQTDMGLKTKFWLHRLAWRVRRQMSGHRTPAEGAATSVYLATSPEVSDQTGLYWDLCEPKKSYSSSYDEEEARKVWEWTCEVLEIKDFFA